MCFHSKQSQQAQALEKRFNAKVTEPEAFQPSTHYNGFSHPQTPIITHHANAAIQHFHWGLIPAWAKDDTIRRYTLNAKIETLHEKPSFRQIRHQRCLVIADGFYEWQWRDSKGKKKQKYLLHLPDNQLFAYAGLWSSWIHPISQENLYTYTIITTEAQGIMREIHNSKQRMPVILSPQEEALWLQGETIDTFRVPHVDILARAVD